MKASLLSLFKKKNWVICQEQRPRLLWSGGDATADVESTESITQQAEEMWLMTADAFKPLKVLRQVFKRQ